MMKKAVCTVWPVGLKHQKRHEPVCGGLCFWEESLSPLLSYSLLSCFCWPSFCSYTVVELNVMEWLIWKTV